LDWVKSKLGPGVKEEQAASDIKAAKEQAKKQGVANVFEDIAETSPASRDRATGVRKHPKPKPTEVRKRKHVSDANY